MLDGATAGVHLVTDPLLRRRIGALRWYGPMPPRDLAETDAVLISHLHRDHLDLPSLTRFGPRTTILIPRGGADLIREAARGPVIEMSAGETITLDAVRVRAVAAVHPDRRDPHRRRPAAEPLGYLVEGSSRVYFAGDTDLFPGMSALGPNLELALIPIGGWGLTIGADHLDPRAAADAVALIRPRIAVPIHWGGLRMPLVWRIRPDLFTEPGRRFAGLVRGADTRVIVAAPGTRIPIERADALPSTS